MDAQRNAATYYQNLNNRCVADFLGRPEWRNDLQQAEMSGERFSLFFVKQFCTSMAEIGYKHTKPEDTVDIRLPVKNVSLYRLAFFSKHKLAHNFWGDVKKYSKPQLDLF